MRGYGLIHPTVNEIRLGYADVLLEHPVSGVRFSAGRVRISQAEVVSSHADTLELGYAATLGWNEVKVIAAAMLDLEMDKANPHPAHDEEFVLYHTEPVEASGFCIHYKLPHYVTFSSSLDTLRRAREVVALLGATTTRLHPWLSLPARGIASVFRNIDVSAWALILLFSFGQSSYTGYLALFFVTFGFIVRSAGYLIKAYSESFEEIEPGVLEALRASGASWWQTIFQAVVPASASALLSWTFVRFEINFSTAIAMGATAGAGGIGFDMFMASAFYLDLRELGAFTYAILAFAMLLELGATRLKAGLGPQRS
jgi:ABC-type nitrate/sulfonate/bicarbonate transport system permease component